MEEINGIAVTKYPWSDASLIGLKWSNEGRNLIFNWMDGKNNSCTLTCTWACAIKIDICTAKNEGGYPLTWDIEFKQLVSEGWEMTIDFGNNGVIEVECNDIIMVAEK